MKNDLLDKKQRLAAYERWLADNPTADEGAVRRYRTAISGLRADISRLESQAGQFVDKIFIQSPASKQESRPAPDADYPRRLAEYKRMNEAYFRGRPW